MAKGEKTASKKWQTPPFRMDWPYLLEEGKDPDTGEPNGYRVTALCPPDFPVGELEDIIYEVYEKQFGTDPEDWPSGRNDRGPDEVIRDCKEKKGKPGYEKGWKFFSMSSRDMPGVIDANKDEVMSKREVYGGRWARATINVAAYNNKSKGVAIFMNNVQLLDHDTALTGRPQAKDEFDEYEMKDRSGGKRRSRDRDDDDEDNDRKERGNNCRSAHRDDDDERGNRENDRGRNRRRSDDDEDDDNRNRGRSRRSRDDDDEDDDRGSRREGRGGRSSRSRDDDEDEGKNSRQRARRRDDDDDDDDRSSRRRSRNDDEDDDNRKSSRRRSRDDDDGWN